MSGTAHSSRIVALVAAPALTGHVALQPVANLFSVLCGRVHGVEDVRDHGAVDDESDPREKGEPVSLEAREVDGLTQVAILV